MLLVNDQFIFFIISMMWGVDFKLWMVPALKVLGVKYSNIKNIKRTIFKTYQREHEREQFQSG